MPERRVAVNVVLATRTKLYTVGTRFFAQTLLFLSIEADAIEVTLQRGDFRREVVDHITFLVYSNQFAYFPCALGYLLYQLCLAAYTDRYVCTHLVHWYEQSVVHPPGR